MPSPQVSLAPRRIVEGGNARFGAFDSPVESANLGDLPFGSRLLPGPLRRLRLKEWQAVQFGNERYFFIAALFNAKTLAIAQLKGIDTKTGEHFQFERRVAPWRLKLAQSLGHSDNVYRSESLDIEMKNRLSDGEFRMSVRASGGASGTGVPHSIAVDIRASTLGQTPEVVCMPLSNGGAMYSHKALVPAEGTLEVDGVRALFSTADSHLVMDDHKGFYPYVMKWNWVTGAGRDNEGRLIGFNLTQNQCSEPGRFTENCLWVDGEKTHFGAVSFDREDVGTASETWRIRDAEERVDVVFALAQNENVNINALVLESRYRGPYGKFSGHMVSDSGVKVDVGTCLGMGEDFYLRT